MYVFNSFHFISLYVDERTRCMHSFGHRSVSFASINQSITSHQSHQQSFEPARKPPPNAYPATRCRPRDGRACTPSVSMRVPPPCVYPGYTHTPSASPLDGPAPVDRDTSTGHARGLISHPPPSPHKKRKTKTKSPPLPLQKCTNKHTTGAVVVVFNPPEGPSDHTRAPACAMDNERCHVSETCGSCVPSTRTGHDSRKTTHAHRPRASHRHRRRRCRVVARIARRQCATRACVRFARRPRTRSSARYPSPPSPRRPSRERDVARARDADENPARRTDATDRRRRPTTNDDDEDESIRTQGRRYGTRGRVSTRAR